MSTDTFDPEPDIGPDDNEAQLLAESEGERRDGSRTIHVQSNVTIFAWLGDIPEGLRQNPNVVAVSNRAPMRIADIPDAVAAAGEAMGPWAPCRECGCTTWDACLNPDPCHWVAPDLCSACAQ